jgi:tungstate transport system substrate-binding protein
MITKHNPAYTKIILTLELAFIFTGCAQAAPQPAATRPPPPAIPDIILATTTSTQDSGLLDALHSTFESQTGYLLKPVAVGSGQALKMGEECNADVLLVHASSSEKELMDKGFGVERKLVMHNDFIIVGPPDDPAGIKGAATAAEALAKITGAGAVFVSRGDDSGTHRMELNLWKAAGLEPQGEWYLESGQGMGATLKIASEKAGYTLTDRAAYLATKDDLALEPLVEGDKALLNVYHVITVNPEKCPKVNQEGANAYASYLVSPETQAAIGSFGVDKFGQPLFYPDADKTDADLGLK